MSQKYESDGQRSASKLVWFAALCALFGGMCMGTILGWSSPALPSMESNSSTPHINASETEDQKQTKTWIGSSTNLGALAGALLGGTFINFLGMKKSLIGLGPPIVVGWVLILCAKNTALMITGRVLTGLAVGVTCAICPAYIAQISTPSIRGLLGTGFQMFVNNGILYMYLWGLGFQHIEDSWRWLCFPAMVPAVLMSLGMFFMPESPQWLMEKFGRSSQVVDSLRRLRSDESDFEGELKELEERAEKAKLEPGFSVEQLKRPDVYKPLIIACALMFFQQFVGINAVLFYSTDIFKSAGSSMDPMVSAVIIAVVLSISVIVAAFMIDKFGRKILLLISGVGMCISLVLLGYFYYDKEKNHTPSKHETVAPAVAPTVAIVGSTVTTIATTLTSAASSFTPSLSTVTTAAPTEAAVEASSLGWLPILSLVLFVIMFSVGIGPIPWMMAAEITPSFALGWISSVGTATNWLMAFIVTKEFEDIQKALESYGCFWLFAGICAAYVLFTLFFIPESKGKSIEEMQRIFMGSNYVEPTVTNNDRYPYNPSKDVSAI